jgi:hypothetical protein
MSYNSKYQGKQVEAYIDKIALGELDNVYVTEFTIDELILVLDSNIPLPIDKDSLVNAVKANKVIAIPYNTDNNGGGCIASVEDYGDVIYFYLKNYYSSIKFFVDTNETNAEITTDYIEVVWWQEALYSGENIKTINGEDILGSGDLELPTKDEVVHKEGDETINGVKTFHAPVKFLQSGDDAITIGPDTRISVNGTTRTVLGLIRGAFFAGSRSYPLYLNGSSERPKYNFDNVELALLSDVSGKQEAIADLDAIRSGASKGATALQSIPSEYVTETELTAKGYATTSALNDKVDKVSGKGLSTEDFTSALKAKLEGLSNYDDTTLANAISGLETRLNTLVSGDASTAIESFNEIMAFLDGVQDTQDLASIIASIEQQIAAKQDKITDLDTIRSGAAKGATALQSYTEKYTGTITGIKMNGASKGTSGVVDLGTVITAHQDISGKADKSSLAAVATSGSYNDLSNKPTIPAAVTESTVSGWGFTKNTGTYSKPSTGIPKTDLASAVQTSLGKADTALQSYTEQYKGTITGVSANGTSVATSGVANIPAASTSAYGVTKLSSATNSTSTSLAATASAVKAAYDLANSYKGTVTGVKINGTTKNPSSGVVDLGTVITSHQDISGKQDKLVSGTNIKTINGTSLLGSGNIVISGGGGSSSGSGAYAEVNHGTSDTTFALTPNTFHVWEEVSALTLTLGSETAGVANEFLFQFTSGATATSLTLPDDIKWANDSAPTIAENMIYQVSVLKGMASVLEFDNKPKVTTISFKIRNYDCIAEEGMTWEQWVSSEYNTINCSLMGNNVQRRGELVGTSYTSYVTKTDVITSDFEYQLIPMT